MGKFRKDGQILSGMTGRVILKILNMQVILSL